jgi:tetratricopeptide (TPR) repeat protein
MKKNVAMLKSKVYQILIILMGLSVCLNSFAQVNELLAVLQPGKAEEAQLILNSITSSLEPAEKDQIIAALEKLSPSGDWIPFLTQLSEKVGGDGRFAFQVARANWRAGNDQEAVEWCEKAVHQSPENMTVLYSSAALAHTLNRVDLAKTWLQQLLKMNNTNADALFLLGRIEASQGNDDAAKDLLLNAIQQSNTHFLAYYELGILELRQANAPEAEKYLKAAVYYFPFFREAYNNLTIALARQNKREEAEKAQAVAGYLKSWVDVKENRLRYAYRNPNAINPALGYELAAELYRVQREDLARAFLERSLSAGKANQPQVFLLAQLRFKNENFKDCLALLPTLSDERITGTEIFAEMKAWCLYHTDQKEESGAYLTQAIQTFPNSTHLKRLQETLAKTEEDKPDDEMKPNRFVFVDAAEKAGISSFQHRIGHLDKRWIIDAMGSGVAVADYDNDGDDDIYFVNAQPDVLNPSGDYQNKLFRNDGGVFTGVTSQAGVGDTGYGGSATFGDIDNDGWLDLFVTNYGANVMYKNNGDGTFRDSTNETGITGNEYSVASAFGDVDGDGDLDLYVGNYVAFDPVKHKDIRDLFHGIEVFTGPLSFDGVPDRLYLNDGNGHFTDFTKESKINPSNGRAMGAVFSDLDQDGDLDLYVANDGTFNHVLQNDGRGVFEDISFFSGGAFNESGVEGASMGIAQGDFNNDGWMDIYITAYEMQPDVLYKNTGNANLIDVSVPMGLSNPSRMLVTWGNGFCDIDSDGLVDLYSINGHIYPQVAELEGDRVYEQGVSFYKNMGERFEDVSKQSLGEGYKPFSGRGSALLDYDQDGDMDIVINNIDATPQLLENRTPHGNWLKVKLKGTSAQTFGVRVVVKSGETLWSNVVDGGSGYQSQNSQTLFFGLGEVKEVDSVTVHWMHKEKTVVEKPEINQTVILE